MLLRRPDLMKAGMPDRICTGCECRLGKTGDEQSTFMAVDLAGGRRTGCDRYNFPFSWMRKDMFILSRGTA